MNVLLTYLWHKHLGHDSLETTKRLGNIKIFSNLDFYGSERMCKMY